MDNGGHCKRPTKGRRAADIGGLVSEKGGWESGALGCRRPADLPGRRGEVV